MSNSDDNYTGVLMEELRDQNKAILETVTDIQTKVKRIEEKVDNQPTRDEFNIVKQQ